MNLSNQRSANPYTVESLTQQIKKLLEMSYADVWVEGEVGSIATPPSGHTYFTLKDPSGILKCVLFKNKKYLAACLPVEGNRILIRGRVSMYTARGEVQLICSYIEAAGEGDLRRQFDALKNKLKAEGLFDEDRKKPLPTCPETIALITSPDGAVLHDIISTLKRRYPLVRLAIYPSSVQGELATKTLLQALSLAIDDAPDLIILARGGGSLEDLQSFNDEAIARAVFASPIPTISAIGHETDFVITDFVADMRAPTPTAAATLVTPDINTLRSELRQNRLHLSALISRSIDSKQQYLDFAQQGLKHPLDQILIQKAELQRWGLRLKTVHQNTLQLSQRKLDQARSNLRTHSPQSQLNDQRHALQTLIERLERNATRAVTEATAQLAQSFTKLNALSPLNTLSRGYSILQNQHDEILKSTDQLKNNEMIKATLHHGKLSLIVDSKSD